MTKTHIRDTLSNVWGFFCKRWHRCWRRKSRHRQRLRYVRFTVKTVGVLLRPNKEATLMTDVTIGRAMRLSIDFFDQRGNPMLVQPALDAPPSWTNADPAIETLTVAADGMTCDVTTLAVGPDVITLSVSAGGKTFSASLDVNVVEEPQALTSVGIKVEIL